MENIKIFKNKNIKLNPYHYALSLIKNRILWDVNYHSWISRTRLRKIKDTYKGGKAVILCNGPSLLKVDFEKLSCSGVYLIGLNKINLLFNKVDFRPDCILAVNQFVIEQNIDFYNSTNIPIFLDSVALKCGSKSNSNITYLHTSNMRGQFARDCSISLFVGNTVTYVAMQLAFHMGFERVTLVGCDHDFSTKGPANQTVISEKEDQNHFDPNYFANGVRWQLPDLFESEVAYKISSNVYENSGRKLYNSTDGGKLEILPRLSLEEFIDLP